MHVDHHLEQDLEQDLEMAEQLPHLETRKPCLT